MPIDYYYECIRRLKETEKQFTVFVFSNGMEWAKENLKLDVPTEFVEGCEDDLDEFFLMSQCRHNIIANSTFSWWSAWLNPNPDKKVFLPHPWFRSVDPNNVNDHFPESWIRVPINYDKNAPVLNLITVSVILAVRNDEQFIVNCLLSLISQNYLYYEIVVVDDASIDHTFDIVKQIAAQNPKIVPIRIDTSIGRSAALNLAIQKARGQYIIFTDVHDVVFSHAVYELFNSGMRKKTDVLHSTKWLTENPNGSVTLINRKFQANDDPALKQLQYIFKLSDVPIINRLNLLASGGINNLLGQNMFRREFILDNAISFERMLDDGADILFLINCFMRAKIFYATPVPVRAMLLKNSSANWEAELQSFIRLLKQCLQSIDNENIRNRLILSFVKQYLNNF